jgi:alkaline phosphatase
MNRVTQQSAAAKTNRRRFLRQAGCVAAGLGLNSLRSSPALAAADEPATPLVRIGLVTDLHYADKPPAGSRHYRDSLAKLAAAGEQFAKARTDLVVELGDFIDAADSLEAEQGFLRRINTEFARLPGPRHCVLGNHCVSALTKPEFLAIVGQASSYYSFDLNEFHFVILDACFRNDGAAYERNNFNWADSSVPQAELDWLRTDLHAAVAPALVFVHQCLDVEPPYGVKNAAEVRQLLEASGRVRAVFQGHHHAGGYRQINGIHYCTLRAMVEGPGPDNNAFAIVEAWPGSEIRLTGFGKQPSYHWPLPS